MIKCQEAYDGGLQQSFILETYDADHVVMLNNMTNPAPVFTVYDLTPGTSFVIVVYAYNSKGRSEPKIIRTSTLATPESLTQRGEICDFNCMIEYHIITQSSKVCNISKFHFVENY
ncbi:hypothetical protein AVEN_29988-1 [Araneus ventricosus]|uniref:Fibronectin type-III domain-containing protein n=1 Tax=Araneus ventricosus TaxID=182803 RepID=A0A4Y2K624_ARAVE|nr:hypothetical protein AVEN_29988-1 [Araneus ventricosus]